ncbi:MAG: dipeptidase [Phycisphaerales bacterium JB037]
MPSPLPLFDCHLDLAHLAELGRDMHAPLHDCRGPLQPAAVTLPTLREAAVRACLGTIFTEAVDPNDADALARASAFPAGDALAAWKQGMRQLKLYLAWRDAGLIDLLQRRGRPQPAGTAPLTLGILMEGADPIETPGQLSEWVEGGVVAIGLAWWTSSRYAGGNGTNDGLTDLGRALIERMDELGVVHDASHLSDKSLEGLFKHSAALVIASHSNCRALLDPKNQRHLTDDAIREIGARGGVVGLNLVRNFIREGLDRNNPKDRPSIAEAIDHVEHVAQVMGRRDGVVLGTDMDGGITADDLPAGINTPTDLHKLLDELRARGWSDAEVRGFAWNNAARLWGIDEI